MKVPLDSAANLLDNEKIVAIPTETVYGLAAKYTSESAIASVFLRKGRPSDNPLIVHIAHLSQLDELIEECSPLQKKLIDAFWPGPLTLLFKKSARIPDSVTASLPTVAIRMPAHDTTRALIALTGPLVAPSANLSGRPSPTTAQHVETDFGSDFPVVYSDPSSLGLESTVVLCIDDSTCMILREGMLTKEALEKVCPIVLFSKKTEEAPLSPGQKYKHYSPTTPVYPLSKSTFSAECILGFNERSYSCTHFISLGRLNDAESIAANLYVALRKLDELQVEKAYVDIDFPDTGLFTTIRERLTKALSLTEAMQPDNK